ncbi:MAG: 50S ribosomal protein L3 [Gammaproteobacteria bacterium]|nr:MAG: 50S ribosomal protein L3 [Gammaproteobacteria bacterium]
MAIGLVGRKAGMTRVFTDEGDSVPVTVIEVAPNKVTQIRSVDTDGYRALQVTTGARRPNRVTRAMKGHFAKAGVEPGTGTWEFRLADDEGQEINVGDEITVDIFSDHSYVDVSGTTQGKGFQGGIKRHNFSHQDYTHGNSVSHRAPGSTGQNQTPGRVFKGKKMAGQMGNVNRTAQNLEVVRIDLERNLLLVKGSVPGSKNGDLLVKPSIKKLASK